MWNQEDLDKIPFIDDSPTEPIVEQPKKVSRFGLFPTASPFGEYPDVSPARTPRRRHTPETPVSHNYRYLPFLFASHEKVTQKSAENVSKSGSSVSPFSTYPEVSPARSTGHRHTPESPASQCLQCLQFLFPCNSPEIQASTPEVDAPADFTLSGSSSVGSLTPLAGVDFDYWDPQRLTGPSNLRALTPIVPPPGLSLPTAAPQNVTTVQTVMPNIEQYYRNKNIRGIDKQDQLNLASNQTSYLVGGFLGGGSFGRVYKAFRQPSQDAVAIKIVKVNANARVSIRTLRAERSSAEMFLGLNHKNIVRIFDVIVTDQRLYIIMEYSEIGNLFDAVQGPNQLGEMVWNALRPNVARFVIKGVAEGIQYLKQHDIAHGDLKIENIVMFYNLPIGQRNQRFNSFDELFAKITDFGNSKTRRTYDPPGQILKRNPLCTVTYAAPESWTKDEIGQYLQYDAISADVFSIGACLLALLTASTPFKPWFSIQSSEEYYNLYCNQMKKSNYTKHVCNAFAHPLRDLLIRTLDPNPQTRLTVEQFLLHQWFTHSSPFEMEEFYEDLLETGIKHPKGKDMFRSKEY